MNGRGLRWTILLGEARSPQEQHMELKTGESLRQKENELCVRLRPHTLPHEAASPHITTRGCVPTHYHTRLRPHTLPHEAASPHITTRGFILTHYHTRLCPHTLPHEAASPHITTRGSAASPHITTWGSVPTHYHTRLRPHTLPHEPLSPYITIRGSVPTHYHMRIRPHTLPHEDPPPTLPQAALSFYVIQPLQPRPQENLDNDAVADRQQQYRQNRRIGYQQRTPEQIDKDRERYHKVYIG
ncbi:unnamed protein product [Ranitomeya imitator]|uniref:Uncharacterized protein n=1 Tax=Ranitomeya imitator TaxID=111125 RepID=A0ABN9M735_9NEOB|nr:unnamed protein product [Ranitomeya imitator]